MSPLHGRLIYAWSQMVGLDFVQPVLDGVRRRTRPWVSPAND
jgi:hypothetical protein